MYKESTGETKVSSEKHPHDDPKARSLPKSILRSISTSGTEKEFSIDKPKMTVGRSTVCDITIDDPTLSSIHFELETQENHVVLRDKNSTNGTYVGELCVREVTLYPGVTIQAGDSSFVFEPTSEVVKIGLSSEHHFGELVGKSGVMREIFAYLSKAASTDISILIEGETGTGKELAARGVHDKSSRKDGPFVVQDCSAIASNLIESTLFGHTKGAFTGAIHDQMGCFELANGGTLFLDEIGELDLSLQPKLLRALERGEFRRVGGSVTVSVDLRVIAATNRDLRALVANGQFREDLYFRLAGVTVTMPPLRTRKSDLPMLVQKLLRDIQSQQRTQKKKIEINEDALVRRRQYDWPGNVRELKNTLARGISMAKGVVLEGNDVTPILKQSIRPSPMALDIETLCQGELSFKIAKNQLVEAFEESYVQHMLELHDGNITKAAKASGLTRYHFRELAKRYSLKK
ncbi:MAG: sigma 54-interacting transcriptional regulator [Myxococcales bacterium]|nr:MAG: sigma 54-interacting transcriptional regulator [Myxococcales bacterium]